MVWMPRFSRWSTVFRIAIIINVVKPRKMRSLPWMEALRNANRIPRQIQSGSLRLSRARPQNAIYTWWRRHPFRGFRQILDAYPGVAVGVPGVVAGIRPLREEDQHCGET